MSMMNKRKRLIAEAVEKCRCAKCKYYSDITGVGRCMLYSFEVDPDGICEDGEELETDRHDEYPSVYEGGIIDG